MRSFHHLSLVFNVFLLSCSPSQARHSSRQDNIRHRSLNNPFSIFDTKHKRDTNTAFTYFDDGVGACGTTNGPNDFIVALNSGQYANGAHCFEMITIIVDGKTAQAQITDECLGCEYGGLDFSQGLFEYFAPLSQGELRGSWSYNSDIAKSSSTTLYTPTPTPTTPTPATTAATSSSSTVSSTTPLTSSMTTSPPTSTTTTLPTSTPQEPQVIAEVDLAVLELGALLQNALKLSA